MKHYEVEHHGLTYTVQLRPDTAETIGAEPVAKDKAPNQKKKVSRGTKKNVHVKHPQNRIPPARRVRLRNNVELPTHSSIYKRG